MVLASKDPSLPSIGGSDQIATVSVQRFIIVHPLSKLGGTGEERVGIREIRQHSRKHSSLSEAELLRIFEMRLPERLTV